MPDTPKASSRSPSQAPSLADLRAEIDRIDAGIHGLLIERSQIIENLIKVKGTQDSGSAFRPAREASMMRRLVERHRGILPLDTVESIWRIIIATFTHVQAPYAVHADMTPGDAAMRDSARFHFGFTVPLVTHRSAAGVVAAITSSKGDLGLVPATDVAGAGAWWSALESESAPKIIARLPFVERPDHPASLPVFAISRSAPGSVATEVQVYSVRVSGWSAKAAPALAALADAVAVPDGAFDGAALLISVPQGRDLADVTGALVEAGVSVRATALVGSHASRYTITGSGPRPAVR
jgi:chorismate mutase